MIAQKMAQLEEQKELAARRKLELENRRIKEMRSKPVEEGGMQQHTVALLLMRRYIHFKSRKIYDAPLI